MPAILERFQARATDAKQQLQAMLSRIVKGEDIDPDEFLDASIAAGLNASEGQALAETAASRAESAQKITKAAAMQPDIDAAATRQSELHAKRKEVEAQARKMVEAAEAEYHDAASRHRMLVNTQADLRERAEAQLRRTCDPSIDAEIAILAQQRDQLERERNTSATLPAAKSEQELKSRVTWIEDLNRRHSELGERIRELEQQKLDPMRFSLD